MTADELAKARRIACREARRGGVSPHYDADDLAQEAALAVVMARRRRPVSGALFARVVGDAVREARARAIKWDAQAAAARLKPAPGRPALDRDEAADVREALGRIDPGLAEAARLKILDGLTNAEAGAALGCCGEVAARRCRAAVRAVAEILRDAYAPEFARPILLRNPERWEARARRIGRKQSPARRRARAGGRQRAAAARLAIIEATHARLA